MQVSASITYLPSPSLIALTGQLLAHTPQGDAVIRNLISHTFHLPLLRITPEKHFSTKAREMQGFVKNYGFESGEKRIFNSQFFDMNPRKNSLCSVFRAKAAVMYI